MTKVSESTGTKLYEIARVYADGAQAGAVYAAAAPPAANDLMAEVVGSRITLCRHPLPRPAVEIELSAAEVLALAAACRAWQAARPGFSSSLVRVKARPYAGKLVEPADLRTVVQLRPVPALAVESEVMIVAELRIVEGRERAGALAGAVYAMPGDWSLEARHHAAVFSRGAARLELRAEDAQFLSALARVLTVQGVAHGSTACRDEAQPMHPDGRKPTAPGAPERHKSPLEMTDEEVEAAFRLE